MLIQKSPQYANMPHQQWTQTEEGQRGMRALQDWENWQRQSAPSAPPRQPAPTNQFGSKAPDMSAYKPGAAQPMQSQPQGTPYVRRREPSRPNAQPAYSAPRQRGEPVASGPAQPGIMAKQSMVPTPPSQPGGGDYYRELQERINRDEAADRAAMQREVYSGPPHDRYGSRESAERAERDIRDRNSYREREITDKYTRRRKELNDAILADKERQKLQEESDWRRSLQGPGQPSGGYGFDSLFAAGTDPRYMAANPDDRPMTGYMPGIDDGPMYGGMPQGNPYMPTADEDWRSIGGGPLRAPSPSPGYMPRPSNQAFTEAWNNAPQMGQKPTRTTPAYSVGGEGAGNLAYMPDGYRPPPFQAAFQNFDGSVTDTPLFGQRDAFIQNLNDRDFQYMAGMGQGPQQYDFGGMWGQAGDMLADGWQNPLAGLFNYG